MLENNKPDVICRRHELLERTLERLEQSVQTGFSAMTATMKEVAEDLREGAVAMSEIKVRLNLLEKVTYTAVGTALTAVLLAVLSLVLKGGG